MCVGGVKNVNVENTHTQQLQKRERERERERERNYKTTIFSFRRISSRNIYDIAVLGGKRVVNTYTHTYTQQNPVIISPLFVGGMDDGN
jgi:hypothetical protein